MMRFKTAAVRAIGMSARKAKLAGMGVLSEMGKAAAWCTQEGHTLLARFVSAAAFVMDLAFSLIVLVHNAQEAS